MKLKDLNEFLSNNDKVLFMYLDYTVENGIYLRF